MNFFKKMIAEIQTQIECKDYAKKKDSVRQAMILMDLKFKKPVDESYVPHDDYQDHLQECKASFVDYMQTSYTRDSVRILGIGDSILAQSKKDAQDVIDIRMNWALGGMRACHMLQLLKDMDSDITRYNYQPNFILVGTPGGNNLLQHQKIEVVKKECNILFDYIRKRFPKARIIMYGLPATCVDYAMIHYVEYTQNLFNWLGQDKNTVIIPLIKHFVAAWHVMMKADYSSDGVHLSPIGRLLFVDLIERSTHKNCLPIIA